MDICIFFFFFFFFIYPVSFNAITRHIHKIQLESHFSLREVDVSLERRKWNKKQKSIGERTQSVNAIIFSFILIGEIKEKIFGEYREISVQFQFFSIIHSAKEGY